MTPREPVGDVVLIVDGITDPSTIPIVQYRASALSLADRYCKLYLADEIASTKHVQESESSAIKAIQSSAKVIHWITARADSSRNSIEAITAALDIARNAWTTYRDVVTGSDFSPKIILRSGQTLRIDRYTSVIGGRGTLIEAPLDIELSVFDKIELRTIPMKRSYLNLNDPRIGIMNSKIEALVAEANREDIDATKKIQRIAEALTDLSRYLNVHVPEEPDGNGYGVLEEELEKDDFVLSEV